MKKITQVILFCMLCMSSTVIAQKSFYQMVAERQESFDKRLKRVENKNTKGITDKESKTLDKEYKKYLRWHWFWKNRVDENGGFDTYAKEFFSTKNINLLKKSQIASTKNTHVTWSVVGPQTFPTGPSGSDIKGIGRIDAIVVDPNNDNHVFIGASGGGIWETQNINATNVIWTCITNDIPIGTVSDLKIANNTLYATSSNITAVSASSLGSYGLGVIRKKLNETEWIISNEKFNSQKIAVFGNDSNIMYSAGAKNVYRSADAGKNWTQMAKPFPEIENSKLILTNIAIHPNDKNKVIVTGRISKWHPVSYTPYTTLVFKTEDGGQSWTNLTVAIEDFINGQITAANTSDTPLDLNGGGYTYASTQFYNDTLYLAIKKGVSSWFSETYFLTLNDDWSSYTLFNSLGSNNKYSYNTYSQGAIFEVIDNQTILTGGIRLQKINNNTHQVNNLGIGTLHQDVRGIDYNRVTGRLIVGTDGGVNRSANMQNFDNVCGNLNLFQAFNLGYVNANGRKVVNIGNQDIGWYKNEFNGAGWVSYSLFGEGSVYADPTNADIVYFNRQRTLYKSTNGGVNYTNTGAVVGGYSKAPVWISSSNNNHLIFDDSMTWYAYPLHISNNQMGTKHNIANGNIKLTNGVNAAIGMSENNASTCYVVRSYFDLSTWPNATGEYTSESVILKSTNFNFNQPTSIAFTDITAALKNYDTEVFDKALITSITVDDTNVNNLWVSFGNLAEGKKVYHSSNGGISWTNISANLPNIPANVIEYDETNQHLFLGTDYGVYYYDNNSEQWARYGVGMPAAIVSDLEIDHQDNKIIVSTYGRSIWTAPLEPCNGYSVSGTQLWTTDHEICGDLIVKNGASLTLNNATIEAENIILEENATLTVTNGTLRSVNTDDHTEFNTNIIINTNATCNLNGATLFNYEAEVHENGELFINANTQLNHSKIKVFDNGYYNHSLFSMINLMDINSSINLYENFKYHPNDIIIFDFPDDSPLDLLFDIKKEKSSNNLIGKNKYASKIDQIYFSGLGSLNVLNTNTIYIQNENLFRSSKYRFDSDEFIRTGAIVNPISKIGNFQVSNGEVTLKAGINITMEPGTIINTSSFLAFIDKDDATTYKNGEEVTEVIMEDELIKNKESEKIFNSLLIYPNPTRKYLNIKLHNDVLINASMKIFNNYGQLMYKGKITKETHNLNIEDYEKGLYIINFEKEGIIILKKIIKM